MVFGIFGKKKTRSAGGSFLRILGFALCGTCAHAIQPVSHYHDLVAGMGVAGFRDGTFCSALFDSPEGLAVDPTGAYLYVADRNNNRIRVVRLEESDRVETLAGTGKAGRTDGPFLKAAFDRPTAIAWLPKDRLVVYDSGNRTLRVLDLASKTVSTLAGNGGKDVSDGDALNAGLGEIWSLLYFSPENSIYFTDPAHGALRKLDLARREVVTLLRDDPRLRRPQALCAFQDRICVAGGGGEQPVYLMKTFAYPFRPPVLGEKIGMVKNVVALAPSDGVIYAIQADAQAPWVRISSTPPGDGAPLRLRSAWGGPIQPSLNKTDPLLLEFKRDEPAALVADPRRPRRFFISSRYLQAVLSVKDYSFNELINGGTANHNGFPDFEYPLSKPPHTFRILVVGNSYVFYQTNVDERRWGWKDTSGNGNRMESMPKRLELMLNTEAALEDTPFSFEVLNLGRASQASYLGLCYKAPQVIQDYDVDLVLYVVTSSISELQRSCNLYYLRPLTKEGMPQKDQDTEYLLGPWREKIHEGVSRRFYDRCFSKNWVRSALNTQVAFADYETIFGDPIAREQMGVMAGDPVKIFKKGFEEYRRSSGRKVDFRMCFVPVREAGSSGLLLEHLEELREFWKGVAARAGVPLLDTTEPFVALSKTYWPIDESGYQQHYNANGHFLFAYILAHELARMKIVPLLNKGLDPGSDK